MRQVPGRARTLESAIGIIYLFHLVLVVAALLVIQSRFDMARFGISQSAIAEQSESGNTSKADEKTGFPFNSSLSKDFSPADFETLSKAESYNADNLYEKIDGKAPLYLEAGFKELSTQRFVNKSEPNLWMELYIYDMGNIKSAFGVYSEQRREGAEAFASMQFAYKSGNALYFVHGKYYAEIIGSSESDKLFKAIAEVAQKTQANLAIDANAGIAELAFFPQENLVPDSFKLYPASAFGFEKLTDIFTARYKVGSETVTAFIGKRADSKEAEATAENYRKFLTENGAVPLGAGTKSTDNKAFVGKIMDSYGTTEIVFTVGPFVAGVHEVENQQAAEKMAEILINKLKSLKNE